MICVEDEVRIVVSEVKRKYSHFVEVEDLTQEAWLWTLEHPKAMEEYSSVPEEDERKAAYRLRRDIRAKLDKVARASRAHGLGYAPEDEEFYGRNLIMNMLPHVLAGDDTPPAAGDSEVHTPSDPAEGGKWHAAYLDVQHAWDTAPLTADQQVLLIERVFSRLTLVELADKYGVTDRTISRRVNIALKVLCDALGGERPHGCPYDCECHEGALRRRPGVHSAWSGEAQLVS